VVLTAVANAKPVHVGKSMFRNLAVLTFLIFICASSCTHIDTNDKSEAEQLKLAKIYDRITEFDLQDYYNTELFSGNEDYLYIKGVLNSHGIDKSYANNVIFAFNDIRDFIDFKNKAIVIPELFGEIFLQYSNTNIATTPYGNFVSPFNENYDLLFSQNKKIVRMRTDYSKYILIFINNQDNISIETNWSGVINIYETKLVNYDSIKLLITEIMPLIWDGSNESIYYINNNNINKINLIDQLSTAGFRMLHKSLICSSSSKLYVLAENEYNNIYLLEIASNTFKIQNRLIIPQEYIHNDTSIMEYYSNYIICLSKESKKILTIPVDW
jgi:hypothetical protein